MTTLLPRLGLRRWLAHKVLGHEFVELRCADLSPRIRSVWRGAITNEWKVCAPGWGVDSLDASGVLSTWMRLDAMVAMHPIRWHPLTPGVAGFYRGTETKQHG